MRLLQIFIQKKPPSHPPAISKPEWPPKPDAFAMDGPPVILPIDSFDILLFVVSTLMAYYFLFHKKQPVKFK